MATTETTSNARENVPIVCPESGVDSASERVLVKRQIPNGANANGSGNGLPNSGKKPACESTIESSLRRNFVKGALATAAAVGIGATVLGGTGLGKKMIPDSSGKSACCGTFCNIYVYDWVYTDDVCSYYSVLVDSSRLNNGTNWSPGLNFGGGGSGEGISSARACGSPNQYGIDFYTGNNKRMSITNSGWVGIGTDTPNNNLCVQGTVAGNSPSYIGVRGTSLCGYGVFGCSPNLYGVLGDSSNGIGVYGTSSGSCGIGVQGNSPTNAAVYGTSCSGTGVVGVSNSGQGVHGQSTSCAGVYGFAYQCGTGVLGWGGQVGVRGQSNGGPGIEALSCKPLVGNFRRFCNQIGDRTTLIQIQNADCAPINWSAGVAGSCNVCKIPDGSFFVGQPSKGAKMVVAPSGNVGIGLGASSTPATSLQVNGSLAAKIATVTASYTMTASDFAILANATSAALTVTLPPAKTASGMIVHIKKIDSSLNVVTVKAAGTDKIEGSGSKSLGKIYKSLMLISDGSAHWYELSSAS